MHAFAQVYQECKSPCHTSPSPKVHPLCQVQASWKMDRVLFYRSFWSEQRRLSKLWQFKPQGVYVKPLYLAHPLLPQVDLRKGKERARCYPVSGAGPHGWCYVDSMKESQDSYKKVGVESKKKHFNLNSWTELGLLQLPLPSEGHPPQRWIDGSTNGYPLFKTVCTMIVGKKQKIIMNFLLTDMYSYIV